MSRLRKIIIAVAVAVLIVVFWLGFQIVSTFRGIPDAYAAWDTGTLLVECLKAHDDRWPTSGDDLLTVMESEHGQEIPLWGSQAGDLVYARALHERVSINWSFDPKDIENASPVTRPNGRSFPMVFQGAEPNEMIRDYFKARANDDRR